MGFSIVAWTLKKSTPSYCLLIWAVILWETRQYRKTIETTRYLGKKKVAIFLIPIILLHNLRDWSYVVEILSPRSVNTREHDYETGSHGAPTIDQCLQGIPNHVLIHIMFIMNKIYPNLIVLIGSEKNKVDSFIVYMLIYINTDQWAHGWEKWHNGSWGSNKEQYK